jgi:acylphosphatase
MPGADSRARLRMIVSSRVQGVFFRVAAAEQARTFGLSGYARNLAEGSFEMVGEGSRAALEHLAAWARGWHEFRKCESNGANRLTNSMILP